MLVAYNDWFRHADLGFCPMSSIGFDVIPKSRAEQMDTQVRSQWCGAIIGLALWWQTPFTGSDLKLLICAIRFQFKVAKLCNCFHINPTQQGHFCFVCFFTVQYMYMLRLSWGSAESLAHSSYSDFFIKLINKEGNYKMHY